MGLDTGWFGQKMGTTLDTTMRQFIFLFFTTAIWFCTQQSQPNAPDKFVVKTYRIALDTNIQHTLYYKNHYYCLRGDRQFICLDNKFEVDSGLTNPLNQILFDFYYLSGDSLIAANHVNISTTITYFLDEHQQWQQLTKMPPAKPFFEDERFTVSTCCVGEWGGAIFFTDKQSKRVHSCPATCATNINKINSSYYVTNSLAHLSGSTEILKIDDPSKLYELKADSLKNFCNWYYKFVTAEDGYAGMKQFEIGTQKLIEYTGIITLTSFIFNNQLYHISTDLEKTFLCKIQGDSLVITDSIFNKPLWSYEPENQKYGEMDLHSFNNRDVSGFITIRNDTISIIAFDRDGPQSRHD